MTPTTPRIILVVVAALAATDLAAIWALVTLTDSPLWLATVYVLGVPALIAALIVGWDQRTASRYPPRHRRDE